MRVSSIQRLDNDFVLINRTCGHFIAIKEPIGGDSIRDYGKECPACVENKSILDNLETITQRFPMIDLEIY